MGLPIAITYSRRSLYVMIPYGENVPQEVEDLVIGSDESIIYSKPGGDTIDWKGERYAIKLMVRTYNSEKLGNVLIEYQANPNNFSLLPKEYKEKLGDLTLIGKKSDYRNITEEDTVREILSNGFYVIQAFKKIPK